MTTDGDFPCCATPGKPAHNWEYGREHDGYSHPGIPPACPACAAERGRPVPLGELLAGTLIASASVDVIVAGLRHLDPARFDEVRRRMALLDGLEYEGSPEAWYALDPADRAALITPAADPEVIRYAALVMDAIHADMARTDLPPGYQPIPRDVGGFSRLQDWRDANEYLIRLIPHVAADCDCQTSPEQTSAGEVHADDCASRADGGSHDAWGALAEQVSTEVDRLLAAEAARRHHARADHGGVSD